MYSFNFSTSPSYSGAFKPDANVSIDKDEASTDELFTAVEVFFDASSVQRNGSGIGFIPAE